MHYDCINVENIACLNLHNLRSNRFTHNNLGIFLCARPIDRFVFFVGSCNVISWFYYFTVVLFVNI